MALSDQERLLPVELDRDRWAGMSDGNEEAVVRKWEI